jgi:hypothetical protein
MDTQLLPYRLKSARRKKRLQKEDRDKQILKLEKEHDLLSNNPDYEKKILLDEPYQKGWKRLFVLKQDIQRSDKAEFYQQILVQVNKVQYHYDASFKKSKRKPKGHRYNLELPELQTISPYDWHLNKAKLTEAQRSCFNKVDYWDSYHYCWTCKYQFAFPELFKIAVLPHMVTTIKIGDALMEQRISFIDDLMYKGGLQYGKWKLRGGQHKYWKSRVKFEKPEYVNPLKNKPKWEWTDL